MPPTGERGCHGKRKKMGALFVAWVRVDGRGTSNAFAGFNFYAAGRSLNGRCCEHTRKVSMNFWNRQWRAIVAIAVALISFVCLAVIPATDAIKALIALPGSGGLIAALWQI